MNENMIITKNKITIERYLSDLDKFTLKFIKILEPLSDYVIISGYVSIILGRSRGSEDIDIIIPKISKEKFNELYEILLKNKFYCLNSDDKIELYDEYLIKDSAIRFALKNTIIPNMELKFATKKIHLLPLKDSIKIILNNNEINISSLELQIAVKEIYLKSQKDIEDAKHIRNIAEKILDKNKLKKYEMMINEITRTE